MADGDVRLAIIGCGSIARRHLIAMAELQNRDHAGFVVTAVCDADINLANGLAQELTERFGVRPTVYGDATKLLEKEYIDGADLCLPHWLHHSVTVDCLESGVHVLCEKPLGITIRAGRLMAETADRTGKILATAVPHRMQPGQRAAHWILNQSELMGTPQTFFHHYTRPHVAPASNEPLPPRVIWRQDRLRSGGGPVLDSGFHYCDSMRYFFGDVESVYAVARELKTGTPRLLGEAAEDTVFVTFTFKSGVVGTWSWSLAAAGEAHHNIIFHGSGGSLRDTTESRFRIFHLFERRPDQHEAGVLTQADGTQYTLDTLESLHMQSLSFEEKERLFPGGTDDGFAIEIWDFLETVRGHRPHPEVDGWEGLRSLAIGEAIYESALTGKQVAVDDVLSGRLSTFQDAIDAQWGLL